MTSPRRTKANRANAAKSSGPRTKAGKRRASGNAFKHGLALDVRLAHAAEIEQLAGEIAGEGVDTIRIDCARIIARALIELQNVRRAKVAFIERITRFGTLKRSFVASSLEEIIFTRREIRQIGNAFARNKMPRLRRIKPKPMPQEEPGLTAEAMHRAIPDLVSLGRFEAAAAARLHRGIRAMLRLGPQT